MTLVAKRPKSEELTPQKSRGYHILQGSLGAREMCTELVGVLPYVWRFASLPLVGSCQM